MMKIIKTMSKFYNLLFLYAVIILSVSACTENPNNGNNSNPQTQVTETPSVQETAKAENQNQTSKSVLSLSTEGITIVNEETGSTKRITFNSDLETTKNVITNIIGQPKETVENSECPAGKLMITTWPNGFTINAAENKFVGWNVRPETESAKLSTMAGIGIGSNVKDLKAAYSVTIFNSSLGVEFNVGQMSGLLSSEASDGLVNDLWAGTNCIFR